MFVALHCVPLCRCRYTTNTPHPKSGLLDVYCKTYSAACRILAKVRGPIVGDYLVRESKGSYVITLYATNKTFIHNQLRQKSDGKFFEVQGKHVVAATTLEDVLQHYVGTKEEASLHLGHTLAKESALKHAQAKLAKNKAKKGTQIRASNVFEEPDLAISSDGNTLRRGSVHRTNPLLDMANNAENDYAGYSAVGAQGAQVTGDENLPVRHLWTTAFRLVNPYVLLYGVASLLRCVLSYTYREINCRIMWELTISNNGQAYGEITMKLHPTAGMDGARFYDSHGDSHATADRLGTIESFRRGSGELKLYGEHLPDMPITGAPCIHCTCSARCLP